MQTHSYFQVDCECGEQVRFTGTVTVCAECGRRIRIESWQVEHTRTPDGRITRTDKEEEAKPV